MFLLNKKYLVKLRKYALLTAYWQQIPPLSTSIQLEKKPDPWIELLEHIFSGHIPICFCFNLNLKFLPVNPCSSQSQPVFNLNEHFEPRWFRQCARNVVFLFFVRKRKPVDCRGNFSFFTFLKYSLQESKLMLSYSNSKGMVVYFKHKFVRAGNSRSEKLIQDQVKHIN